MRLRVFLDTNVFIFAYEFPKSNSRLIIDLLNEDEIDVVVSESVVKEVYKYFRKFYSKKLADEFRGYLFEACTIVFAEDIENSLDRYRNMIKEKDLEQLATVKGLGIKYLVSYDEDFVGIEEYRTPKQFITLVGLEGFGSEY